MDWYNEKILPYLVHLGCGQGAVAQQRQKVVPRARGRVLEVGLGTGLNLAFYDPQEVWEVVAVEPSAGMLRHSRGRVEAAPFPVEILHCGLEEVPSSIAPFDSAVLAYTLCSMAEPAVALGRLRELLKPEGTLHFCEHGASSDLSVRRWQDRLTPFWRCVAGGCHLNRDVPALLREAGFSVDQLETGYLPGWRAGTYQFWGAARRSGELS